MQSAMERILPEIDADELAIWDDGRQCCCGYLNKKASQTSAFSKGKWQKRWFEISLDAEKTNNYVLEYYHTPEEKAPRASYSLTGAAMRLTSETGFVLNFTDGTSLSLNADNATLLRDWAQTIEKVIATSNARDRLIQTAARYGDDNEDARHNLDEEDLLGGRRGGRSEERGRTRRAKNPLSTTHTWPTLRLDLDMASIPTGSSDRIAFEDAFVRELSAALDLPLDGDLDSDDLPMTGPLQVVSVRPCPGMDWLSLVEFDIHIRPEALEDPEDEDEYAASSRRAAAAQLRQNLLTTLHDMLAEPSSPLFRGLLGSRIDPSYSANLLGGDYVGNNRNSTPSYRNSSKRMSNRTGGVLPVGNNNKNEVYSSHQDVLAVLLKYRDIEVPSDFECLTHFEIIIEYDNKSVSMAVPNPAVLRPATACLLWPFELKQALGFMHTMQELWVEPLELIPRDGVTRSDMKPIPFAPSHRVGGQIVLSTLSLRPGAVYELRCADRRDEAVNSLSPEEMDSIKETFKRFDRNGDGGISKAELKDVVRERTAQRRAIIEEKFRKFVDGDEQLTNEEMASAEAAKARYLQQVTESQTRFLQMLEAADVDGDGVVTVTEFILAEAWWLRCTINPERAHLF